MEKYELVEKNNMQVPSSELVVKKSKFISSVYYITNKLEAEEIIAKTREEYKDAKHLVYAYMLKEGGKYTDDKEPQGTAGKPIYSLLEKQKLTNILVIVIRYFGGILLGTGPLTRAYTMSTKQVIEQCDFEKYVEYDKKIIECKYNEEMDITNKLEKMGAKILNKKYEENIEITALIPKID